MTLAMIICILGFLGWVLFSKTKMADALLAEAGRIAFAFGLLAWLLSVGGKSLF